MTLKCAVCVLNYSMLDRYWLNTINQLTKRFCTQVDVFLFAFFSTFRSWGMRVSKESLLWSLPTNRTSRALKAQRLFVWHWTWEDCARAGPGSSSPAQPPPAWGWRRASGGSSIWWRLHSNRLKRTLRLRWSPKGSVSQLWKKWFVSAADDGGKSGLRIIQVICRSPCCLPV